jgi:4'-phosphopantetheinyl transferase
MRITLRRALTMPHQSSPNTVSSPLNPRGVEVWRVGLAISSTMHAAAAECLPPDELAHIDSFKRPEIRTRQLLAHAALRSLLAKRLNMEPRQIAFCTGAHGKPMLAGKEAKLQFNLSHSCDLALIAISEAFEVGVDVEQIRPMENLAKLAERFFMASEASALAALSEETRTAAFFRVWTRKESLLKATGIGIANGLQRAEVSCEPQGGLIAWDGNRDESARWTMHTWNPANGYVATVATHQPGVSIAFRDFEFATQ